MYYFDNRLLGQYLSTGVDLKVFINGVYYILASEDDVRNPAVGYGYDLNGNGYEFDYRAIEHILINGIPLDIEQLEKAYKGTEEKSDSGEKEASKDSAKDDKKAEESFKIGDFVQNIDPVNNAFTTRGSVVLIENNYITYEYYSDDAKRLTRKTVPSNMLKKIN